MAVHVSEAEISARMPIGQFFVIQSQQVQNGGMPIVNVHFALDGLVPVFVGGPVAESALYPAAGHPGGVSLVVVVAPVTSLAVWCPSEFTGPDDEGVLQEVAALEIRQEAGNGFVDLGALGFHAFPQVPVVIP